jgi:hypothetical protein
MIFDCSLQYTIEKIFLRAIKYSLHLLQIGFFEKYMSVQSFKIVKVSIPGKKCHLDVTLVESCKVYYREGSGVSSQKLQAM